MPRLPIEPEKLPELICEDCLEKDHLSCLHEGGWMHQETFERCGCHLTKHLLDNRA